VEQRRTVKFDKIMNTNRTAPLNAARASAIVVFAILVFIVVAIFYLITSLFSGDKKKTKPNAPANTEAESSRKEAETTRENPVFRNISAEISVKPAGAPVPTAPREIISQPVVPTLHKIISPAFASAVTTHPKGIVQPAPIKKPGISRNDMAKAFRPGALTRQAAVAELKKLGFGQTAAYAALLPDGRFSAWLHFAPDGIITWNG
jgi:hypothetical protein